MSEFIARKVSEHRGPSEVQIDIVRRRMPGMFAWLLHRITGIGITFYLLFHIATIGTLIFMGGPDFNRSLAILMHNPWFLSLDFLLLAAVLIHALNGIRILIIDFGVWILHQKALFYTSMAVAFVLFVLGLYRILS